jgi:hypothetical protein
LLRRFGGGKMDSFAASYAATLLSRGVEGGDPAPIMGYYRAADVPVFDHLASEFTVLMGRPWCQDSRALLVGVVAAPVVRLSRRVRGRAG